MTKYFKYAFELFRVKNIKLFPISFRYFLFKKVPQTDILIQNPSMGNYYCRANTTDFIFSFLAYEYKIKEKIQQYLNEFDVYFDIGACIGDYSIWLSKNHLKSYAFEPNKDNYASLLKNIKLNHLENNIQTFQYGLGCKAEKVIFKTHPNNKGYSGKFVNIEGSQEQEVEIKVFDEIFPSLNLDYGQSFIVKIDAEGMEADIIAGAKKFFANARKILLIFEAHSRSDETLKALRSITEIQLIEMDELNLGVLIEHK